MVRNFALQHPVMQQVGEDSPDRCADRSRPFLFTYFIIPIFSCHTLNNAPSNPMLTFSDGHHMTFRQWKCKICQNNFWNTCIPDHLDHEKTITLPVIIVTETLWKHKVRQPICIRQTPLSEWGSNTIGERQMPISDCACAQSDLGIYHSPAWSSITRGNVSEQRRH